MVYKGVCRLIYKGILITWDVNFLTQMDVVVFEFSNLINSMADHQGCI
jgi:hypothetical protein